MKKIRDILGYILLFAILAFGVIAQMIMMKEEAQRTDALKLELDAVKSTLDTLDTNLKEKLEAIDNTVKKLDENSDAHTKQIEGINKVLDNLKKELDTKEKEIRERIDQVEQAKLEKKAKEAELLATTYTATADYAAPTSGLTPTSGINNFNGHTESYYNLPMDGLIEMARNNGIEGEYWVNPENGVKMYGDYVICATNRDIYPYGTLLETSFGTGISLDTGGFVEWNPGNVDIATSW